MNNNHQVIESQTSSNIGHITRGVVILLLVGVVYTVVGIRDDTRDFKKEIPKIQEHLNGIDKQMQAQEERSKTFATRTELQDEATRVTNEFKKQLNEQLKKKKLITTPGNHDYDN
jgi:flagellar biogenesis protein FliO